MQVELWFIQTCIQFYNIFIFIYISKINKKKLEYFIKIKNEWHQWYVVGISWALSKPFWLLFDIQAIWKAHQTKFYSG